MTSGRETILETAGHNENVNSFRHEPAISFAVISQPFKLSKRKGRDSRYRAFSDSSAVCVSRQMDLSTYDFTKLGYKTRNHSETGESDEDEPQYATVRSENRPVTLATNQSLKRRVTIHEPPRGVNRIDRQDTLQRLQSLRRRHAVQALLKSFANSSEKSENERVEGIEKAFTWIRNELSELREQDKDIMRMFTRIQAGIRQLKAARTVSEGSDVSVDDESVDNGEFLHVPIVKTFSEPPRRMSVV